MAFDNYSNKEMVALYKRATGKSMPAIDSNRSFMAKKIVESGIAIPAPRKATGGRRPAVADLLSLGQSRIQAMRQRELAMVLTALAPKLKRVIQRKTRDELVEMGLLSLQKDTKKVWDLIVKTEAPAGAKPAEPWIKTMSVEERVQGEVSAVQAAKYNAVIDRVLGSGHRNMSDADVMRQWATENNISSAIRDGVTVQAMDAYLGAQASQKDLIADRKAKARRDAEAAKTPKTSADVGEAVKDATKKETEALKLAEKASKTKKTIASLQLQLKKQMAAKNEKAVTAIKGQLKKHGVEAKALDEMLSKAAAATEVAKSVARVTVEAVGLSTSMVFVTDGPGMSNPDGAVYVKGKGPAITSNWTPVFSKEGYLCTPSVDTYAGGAGSELCVHDTGESGTNINAVVSRGTKMPSRGQVDWSGREWGTRSYPGKQPKVTIDGKVIKLDRAANVSGYQNKGVMPPPEPKKFLASSHVRLAKDPEGAGVFGTAYMACNPTLPVRYFRKGAEAEDGVRIPEAGYYCVVADPTDFMANDPMTYGRAARAYLPSKNEKNMTRATAPGGRQYVKMPEGWIPFSNVGQDVLRSQVPPDSDMLPEPEQGARVWDPEFGGYQAPSRFGTAASGTNKGFNPNYVPLYTYTSSKTRDGVPILTNPLYCEPGTETVGEKVTEPRIFGDGPEAVPEEWFQGSCDISIPNSNKSFLRYMYGDKYPKDIGRLDGKFTVEDAEGLQGRKARGGKPASAGADESEA